MSSGKGRKRKPAKLRAIDGGAGKKGKGHFHDNTGPDFVVGGVVMPEHLRPEAQDEWRRVAEELEQNGLLSFVDMAAFTAYCEAWGTYAAAMKSWNDFCRSVEASAQANPHEVHSPFIVKTGAGGYKPNPLEGVLDRTRSALLKAASEFGMTPAARSRVNAMEKGKKNAFQSLLDES